MNVMTFLSSKPNVYIGTFLDTVEAHRRQDEAAVEAGIDDLIGYHPAAADDPAATRALLRQMITDASAMAEITDMAAESYANKDHSSETD